jgi:hypothetical protein
MITLKVWRFSRGGMKARLFSSEGADLLRIGSESRLRTPLTVRLYNPLSLSPNDLRLFSLFTFRACNRSAASRRKCVCSSGRIIGDGAASGLGSGSGERATTSGEERLAYRSCKTLRGNRRFKVSVATSGTTALFNKSGESAAIGCGNRRPIVAVTSLALKGIGAPKEEVTEQSATAATSKAEVIIV